MIEVINWNRPYKRYKFITRYRQSQNMYRVILQVQGRGHTTDLASNNNKGSRTGIGSYNVYRANNRFRVIQQGEGGTTGTGSYNSYRSFNRYLPDHTTGTRTSAGTELLVYKKHRPVQQASS